MPNNLVKEGWHWNAVGSNLFIFFCKFIHGYKQSFTRGSNKKDNVANSGWVIFAECFFILSYGDLIKAGLSTAMDGMIFLKQDISKRIPQNPTYTPTFFDRKINVFQCRDVIFSYGLSHRSYSLWDADQGARQFLLTSWPIVEYQ